MAKIEKDFENLWEEDVFEVLAGRTETTYFEYEIRLLNYELPILVPNFEIPLFPRRPGIMKGAG